MLNTRRTLARTVAAELIAIEEKIDGALVGHARLQVAVIEGRRAAKLPLHTGQDGIEQMTAAASALIAARKAIHDAHMTFRAIQDDMGLGPMSYGDYGDTPRTTGTMALVDAA